MELRVDPLRGHITLIAESRRRRPKVFSRRGCPFCRGAERETPPGLALLENGEIVQERGDWRPSNWIARIFPNLYPALTPNPPAAKPPARPAKGLHMVAVETWRHTPDPHQVPPAEYAAALGFILNECRKLLGRYGYVVLFKNRGKRVGASIEHTHMQIIAMEEPPPIEEAWSRTAWRSGCPVCRYISWEDEAGVRVIRREEGLILAWYWAARQPGHMVIAPLHHEEYPSAGETMPIALLLSHATRILVERRGVADYNVVFRFKLRSTPDWHWFIEVLPYTQTWGGLERNTHTYIVEA